MADYQKVTERLFYVSDKYLSRLTEESYTKPTKLQEAPHWQLYFDLFKLKVRIKRKMLFVPALLHNEFSKTKHFSNFMANPIFSGNFEIDGTIKNWGNSEGVDARTYILVESATYKSGEYVDASAIIICCDDEVEEVQEFIDLHNYPVTAMTVTECIEMLQLDAAPPSIEAEGRGND